MLKYKYGVKLNKYKFFLTRSKINPLQLNMSIDNEQIRRIQHSFTYCGSNVTEDGRGKTNVPCTGQHRRNKLYKIRATR